MTQYKDTTKLANTPTGAGKGIIERITTVMLFAFLLIFGLCLISCQPSHAGMVKNEVNGNSRISQCRINNLQNITGLGDNADLTKNYTSDLPSRSMAFFMPENPPAPHAGEMESIAPLTQFTGLNRHTYAHSVTSYGGVTLQNIKAFRRICRAVAGVTESEPRQPIFNGLVLTQNITPGGHNHA